MYGNIHCSVQFSPLIDWVTGGTQGTIQQRSSSNLFCRSPLWAVLTWAGMSTLWCCQSSISSTDHGITLPSKVPWMMFSRDCHGVWHVRMTIKRRKLAWFWHGVVWTIATEDVEIRVRAKWCESVPEISNFLLGATWMDGWMDGWVDRWMDGWIECPCGPSTHPVNSFILNASRWLGGRNTNTQLELTSFARSSVLTVLGTVCFDHFIHTVITFNGKVYGNWMVARFDNA